MAARSHPRKKDVAMSATVQTPLLWPGTQPAEAEPSPSDCGFVPCRAVIVVDEAESDALPSCVPPLSPPPSGSGEGLRQISSPQDISNALRAAVAELPVSKHPIEGERALLQLIFDHKQVQHRLAFRVVAVDRDRASVTNHSWQFSSLDPTLAHLASGGPRQGS